MKKKRWLFILGFVFFVVGGVVLVVTNPVTAEPFDFQLQVQPEILRRDTQSLVAVGDWRNFASPETLDMAAGFIRNSWQNAGFEVREQVFAVDGVNYRNLVAVFGPETGPLLVVGAHYDVCGEQQGADDNASSVAALLELSRMLQKHQPALEYRIELVAFTLEEPPMFRTEKMGSAHHAASLELRGADVRAVIVLDMIGYYDDSRGSQGYPVLGMSLLYGGRANFICVVGNLEYWGLVRRVKARMKGAGAIPVRSINAPGSLPGIDFSDHLNYWSRGYPAVLITDTSFYRNANYHTAGDTIETLDFERMAEVVKGLYAMVTTL